MKNLKFEDIRNANLTRFSGIKLGYVDDDIIVIDKLDVSTSSIKLDFIIMVVCTGGELQLNINNQEYVIYPNNILICTPNLSINNYKITPNFSGKILCLSRKFIHEIFRNASDIWEKTFYIKENPIINMDERGTNLYYYYYNLIDLETKQQRSSYHKKVMKSLVQAVFYELSAYLNDDIISYSIVRKKTGQGYILFRKFIDSLSQNEIKRYPVSYYGEKLFVSPKYLSNVCKHLSGKTASDWINEYVMEDIKYLLKFSDKSIKEVSLQLNFPNVSFFGKYVKAHLEMSPTEYRNSVNPCNK